MMSKIRKMQDTWVAKSIFILTALSFMSLFGISGYLYSAGQNRTVIKVNDIEISQNEIAYKYDKQLQMARDVFGNRLELTDEMRTQILLGLVRNEVVNAIVKTAAEENDIVIGDDLIRKLIYSQIEFMGMDGKFDINRFRMALNRFGLTEQEYIANLQLDVQKRILAYDPAQNVNVPDFMAEYLGQIDNQKRVFKYVDINPEKVSLDRKITSEELEQYYHDFADNFMAPEKRDVSYLTLSVSQIESQYQPSEEEINAYYNANIELFETPEKRSVLQMVFQDENDADKAVAALKAGKDFKTVAKENAEQSEEDTNLGEVSKDMLLEDIAEEVFALAPGEVSVPMKSEFGWHVMKVVKIIPAKKMPREEAEKLTVQAIRKEKSYDAVYDYIGKIEDRIGSGETLENLGQELHADIRQVKGVTENVSENERLPYPRELIDEAFSYNVGEISRVVETDTGLLIVRVDNITDAHLLDLEQVRPEIEKMWANNERDVIAQDYSNDIMYNLEEGGSLDEAAKNLKLKVYTSAPIKRSETFAGLPSSAVAGLFQLSKGTPKMIELGSKKVIVIPTQIISDSRKLSAAEIDAIKARTQQTLAAEAANAIVDTYAEDYDVRVKYKLLGLAD